MYKIDKTHLFNIIHVEQPGIKISFLDYGATIYTLQTKDISGNYEDIVLEYINIKDYIDNDIYLNGTIGPIAGRVKNGIVKTKNKNYLLDKNFLNKHTLHSGKLALTYKNFDFKVTESSNYTDVIFTYHESKHSRINYTIKITYRVSPHQVKIIYNLETELEFVFNITNHAYFNLSGNLKRNIKNHVVKLNTKKHHSLDNELLINNKIIEEKLYDFTDFKPLYKTLDVLENKPVGGLDDIYYFPNHQSKSPMAIVYEPISKRMMEVYTSYDHMVFYTHNNTNDKPLKHLDRHPKHNALCFECQKSPYGFSHENATKLKLSSNNNYNEFITFKFGLYTQ